MSAPRVQPGFCRIIFPSSSESVSRLFQLINTFERLWRFEISVQKVVDIESYPPCLPVVHPVEGMAARHSVKYFILEIFLSCGFQGLDQMLHLEHVDILIVCICMDQERSVLIAVHL